ncbi:VWA domain-containing protein, partial [bacterium]|nr:VWA domain-containing protein [bacterium]
ILCCNTHISTAERELMGKLKKIEPSNGTNITSGLYKAQEIINDFAQDCIKRIVILTDGQGGNPLNIAAKLKKENVVIDVIGIGGSHSEVNEPLLKKVASVVDGVLRYRFIGDRNNLVAHFTKIAGSLVRK